MIRCLALASCRLVKAADGVALEGAFVASLAFQAGRAQFPTGRLDALMSRSLSTTNDLASLIKSKPRSLEVEKGPTTVPQQLDSWWGKAVLSVLGFYSKRTHIHQSSLDLFATIKAQGQEPQLYKVFGLDPEQFMSQYMMLSLHMWLIIVRLRGAGPEAGYFRQQLYDCFQEHVERQVYSRVQVHPKKWIKQLEGIFYGSGISYDKSIRGDGPPLPDALLKNVYGNDPQHRHHAEMLSTYLLRELECLQMTSTDAILRGALKFSPALEQIGQHKQGTPAHPQQVDGSTVQTA